MKQKRKAMVLGTVICVVGGMMLIAHLQPNILQQEGEVMRKEMQDMEPEKEPEFIPEGWCVSKSRKGESLSQEQGAVLDDLVQSWREKSLTDEEVQVAMSTYLMREEIPFIEVTVIGGSHTIRDEIPEIVMYEDGSLYQYQGIYSTGVINQETNRGTECEQWTIFIF